METAIKRLEKLGFKVEMMPDVVVVKKGDWHMTFLDAGTHLVTFGGRIKKENLAQKVLQEYGKEYREELKRFILNLFGKELAEQTKFGGNFAYYVRAPYATFRFSGKKLIDVRDIKDYRKVTEILNHYEEALKG